MGRFLLRRCLLSIPTVLGVVLITFILFHVVGGSPAAQVLGQNAGAQAMEEFDAARGYDKPLFFGNWTPSRALADFDAATASPSECARWGAEPGKGVALAEGEALEVPLAFPLSDPNTKWRLELRFADGHRERLDFAGGETPSWTAGPGGALLTGASLRKATRGWWDSQLWHYAGQLAHLDFGKSTSMNRPVSQLLKEGIGPSLMLTIPILVVELFTSLALSLWCVHRKGRLVDRALVAVCVALMSVNYLVWIVVGQFVLAYKWGWFPVWGFESWKNLLLPVLIGVVTGLGTNVRFYRTILLEEANADYVRTARAKGLGEGRILWRHVLRNAMGPVIVNVALALPFLYTGSLLLENFFGIPGLGYLSLNAIYSSDVEVIRAVVLVGALLFTAANVLADVALAWADPRVKLS